MKKVLFCIVFILFLVYFSSGDIVLAENVIVVNVGKSEEFEYHGNNVPVYWFSTDESVAKVKDGVVEGVSEGECTLVGVYGLRKETVKIRVDNPKLSETDAPIKIGESHELSISGITSNTDISLNIEDESILDVVSDGYDKYILNGKKDGSSEVRFTVNNEEFMCNVSVTHDCVEGGPVVEKEANCYHGGTNKYYCKICKKELRLEQVPKQEHDYKRSICTKCNDVQYVDEDDKTVVIYEGLCNDIGLSLNGNVKIPKVINLNGVQFDVVGIGYALFYGNEALISVDLPDSIVYIGSHAFDGCKNLEYVNMHEGVKYIEEAAFQLCSSLKFIDIPNSVEYIGNFSYNHCTSAENEIIKLPSSLKSLGRDIHYPAHMFYDCGKDNVFKAFSISAENEYYKVEDGILYTKDGKTLVAIPRGKSFESTQGVYIMPDTVTNIGELALGRCGGITKVVISDNLSIDSEYCIEERIAYNNFGNDLSVGCYGFSGVKEYDVKETNEKYKSVNGVLYTKDGKTLVAIPNQYEGVLSVPEGTVEWGDSALLDMVEYFKGQALNKIQGIEIPSTMTKIDSEQLEIINSIVNLYGTFVTVNQGNPAFMVDSSGLLVAK